MKTPPQETLLKLEKDQALNELSVESTMFAFKLGFAKLECSLLMNGLVYEPNEVLFSNPIKYSDLLASNFIGVDLYESCLSYIISFGNS